MNVLFFWVSTFVDQSSGMERVLCNFANERIKRGDSVSIGYCTEKNGGVPYFPIDENVRLFNLLGFGQSSFWESKPYLSFMAKMHREFIRLFNKRKAKDYELNIKAIYLCPMIQGLLKKCNPDIIISFEPKSTYYMQTTLRKINANIPLITMFHFSTENAFDVESTIETSAIKNSNMVQVLTKADEKSLRQVIPNCHVTYIPNIVPQYEDIKRQGERTHVILNVGRLDRNQKRQHILLESFASLIGEFPDWKVILVGEDREQGLYLAQLQEIIRKYQMDDRVIIHSPVKNILAYYCRADIFAFPSSYEGFPLAMTEAMSTGLPVVGMKNCIAVKEIIHDGEDGILTNDDVDSFAEGLRKLMIDDKLRIKMGEMAHRNMAKYSPNAIWNQWNVVINQLVSHAR